MAAPAQTRASAQPSAELRRIQADLRAIVQDDQEDVALATSVAEGIHRIAGQLDRLAGLQELFEWWHELPL